MAERANPDNPDFQDKRRLEWTWGFIPRIRVRENPYREAFFWRYGLVARSCRDKDVLEIPCGMGWGSSLLQNCRSLVGVDISEEAVAEAQRRYGRRNLRFQTGSMERLEFPDASFDMVVCLEGIEHVPEPVGMRFIEEAVRVLRHRGELFLSSPMCITGPHSGNPYHVREYTHEEMARILSAHFVILHDEERTAENVSMKIFHCRKKDA